MRLDAIRRLWERLRASGGDADVLNSDSFTDSERAVGRLVLPLLADLDEAKKTIDELTNRTRALSVTLDLLSVPAIVIDVDGRFLTSNRRTQELFGGSAIPANVLLAAATSVRSGTEHETTIISTGAKHERVRVVPADIDAAAERQADDPAIVFLVSEGNSHRELEPATLVTRLGVTPAQARVLSLVAQGLTNREISERLDISIDTVHSHLANSYTRLGVSNRAAAVAAAYGAQLRR